MGSYFGDRLFVAHFHEIDIPLLVLVELDEVREGLGALEGPDEALFALLFGVL